MKPDPVFQAIVDTALEFVKDTILIMDLESLDVNPDWAGMFPELAALFTRRSAVTVIDQLLAASRDSRVYRLTNYHWLMLYVCLRFYCENHEDLAADQPNGLWPVGSYEIGSIAFEQLIDRYFWDTDFAFETEVVDGLGPEGREYAGVADEVFGIAHSLPPHPEELQISLWDDPTWEIADQEMPPPEARLPRYPPDDDATGEE